MSADRIDHTRDDVNRAERERADRRRERPSAKTPIRTDFAVKFEHKIKMKDKKETEETRTKDGKDRGRVKEKNEKGSLFTRIVEVAAKQHKEQQKEFFGSEEGQKKEGQEKEGGEKEGVEKEGAFFTKDESPFKDDFSLKKKKEEKKEEEGKPKESRSRTSGDKTEHARVESVASQHEGGKGSSGGGGSGGGGGFFSGGGGASPGKGDGGSSSFSGGKNSDSSSGGRDEFKGKSTEGGRGVRPVGSFQAQGESTSGGQRQLRHEDLDQMIKGVRLCLTASGEKEMEIEMSDQFFSGLKLRVTTSEAGVIVTLLCPNRNVTHLLLINRPRIYEALSAKKILVARVDVIPV